MVRILKILCLFLIVGNAFAFDVPLLKGHVNDYAKLLSSETVNQLEYKLTNYEKDNTRQFVILTTQSLDGESIESASIKVANKWKLGTAKENNGLLLFVSVKDRKIRIEVGSGIEDIYTDIFTGRIIDSIITPNFKEKKFDKGIADAVDALMLGTIVVESVSNLHDIGTMDMIILIILIVVTVIVFGLNILSKIKSKNNIDSKNKKTLDINELPSLNGINYSNSDSYDRYNFDSRSNNKSSTNQSSNSPSNNGYKGGGGSFSGGGSSGSW